MMYCSFDIDDIATEVLFMLLFSFICVAFLWLMSFNIGTYFSPVLKIISLKLHMNEYLAGVTFLAFGNCSPEIIANLMPVRADAPIFTITVGNTLAIILLSGGTVCFLRPFRMNGHSTLRDLLFLLLGVEVLRFVMIKEGAVTLGEGIVLFVIYVVYVAINIADLALLRYYIRKLRRELEYLESLTPPPIKEINAKLRKLISWEEQDDIGIKDTTKYRRSRDTGNHFSNMTSSGYFVTPIPERRSEHVDYESNRTALYDSENPKNLQLFTEFLQSLNPVDPEAWQLGGWSNRIYLIARCPLVFVLQLFIPVVDYEKVKHGWSKLLNCTQIVTNPFVVITLVHLLVHAPSGQFAVAVVSNLQRSRSSSDRRRLVLILLASDLGTYIRRLLARVAEKACTILRTYLGLSYREVSISPDMAHRLSVVGRKTLVLDLDETLVHSCYLDPDTHDNVGCSQLPENARPDYVLNISIDGMEPIVFRVFKRPHVDEFLDFVSKWYDLVIYTASLEAYAAQVVDQLDAGRGLITRRFYRQHCRASSPLVSKDLTLVSPDMSGVLIIDNSPYAYRDFPDNAVPIKTFIYDPDDTELLKLLPFLDALRFTKDVRSILGRRVIRHYHNQSTISSYH
ncbi:GD10142 [Drosophila simulans]|uniref:GD10142 n=1 Tax=Drosophila simulans TaxID=7240 RepID=B4QG75_DROSI|nr:GD10142 [Drosophila simulans]